MSIRFRRGIGERIRRTIQESGGPVGWIAKDIFRTLEWLDEHPAEGRKDAEGKFGGAYVHQFRLEYPPRIMSCSVAYDVEETAEGHIVWVIDFALRFVLEE